MPDTLKWFGAHGFTVADDGDAGTLRHSATVESARFGRLSESQCVEHDLNRDAGAAFLPSTCGR